MLPLIVFLALANPLNSLNKVGEAEFSVMFIDIYDITLYSDTSAYNPASQHYALSIKYHRNVSAERLVSLTQDQWEHLGIAESDIQKYGSALQALWPDVKKGDNLTIHVTPGTSHFYHNNTAIGAIDDAGFGHMFTDIWLSPETSAPGLRRDLLGKN